MRKTNKKCLKSSGKRSGVLLLTILFITAMALIFITTALTITIATRKRIYENAKADQARLTVTSLSQAIWNAIYTQQINDIMLENLARGGASNGTLVQFTASEIPGMNGTTGTDCSAYFYVLQEPAAGVPLKVAVECKCEIDGYAQYYTMVMEKHDPEGSPSPMFNLTVDLGDTSMLNSCNFGLDASKITNNQAASQTEYMADDNVMFIHGTGTSDQDSSAFYCKVISDGVIYLRDVIFADNLYLIGENAGFDWSTTSQSGLASSNARGNIYFWGTKYPFYNTTVSYAYGSWGPITGMTSTPRTNDSASVNLKTFENMYFDLRAIDGEGSGLTYNTTTQGFQSGTDGTSAQFSYRNPNGTFGIHGSVYYENGITVTSGQTTTGWQRFDGDQTPAALVNKYLKVDDDNLDTVGEVQSELCGNQADATEINATDLATINSLSADSYEITGGTLDHWIDLSTAGDTFIYVTGDLHITKSDSGNGGGFRLAKTGSDIHAYIIIENNAVIYIDGGNSMSQEKCCGFIDQRCFTGTNYNDVRQLNQTTTPRFYIFTTYTGGNSTYALRIGNTAHHDNMTVTAYVGFYPSTKRGNNGCALYLTEGSLSNVFYGRIAASALTTSTGGNFNIPYCPTVPDSQPNRPEAYRDNTDFSVINEECGYFTISNT